MAVEISGNPPRDLGLSLRRGALLRCPNCGIGKLFASYLKVAPQCRHCGEELHHHRADDAPPYFTILLLGHVLVPMLLAVEVAYRPELWVHAMIWFPITVASAMTLLPHIKGALVNHQWALYMHGFDPHDRGSDPFGQCSG